tara:strand:- start:17424 stop:18131 length:708 start_codon:yes stop_codon:yes gene_type:complete
MKILAVILARKGSKRLKNKNLIYLNKKKLINHTFDLLKTCNLFTDTIVSSNDNRILNIAKKYKNFISVLRPESLSSDGIHPYKVTMHACKVYQKPVDGIFVFQPTSPLRKIETIKKMINIFKKNKMKNSVVSVSKVEEHPEWMLEIKKGFIKPLDSFKAYTKMSQKLKNLYRVNGLGYLITPKELFKEKTLVPKSALASICDSSFESIDIDTADDFLKAKSYVNYLNKNKKIDIT